MVIVDGFIYVAKADLTHVKEELARHIALTRKESGCLVFNVEQSKDDIYKFLVYEKFDSEASFKNISLELKSRGGAL